MRPVLGMLAPNPASSTRVTVPICGARTKKTEEGCRARLIDEAFNSDKLIAFLEALIKDAGKKVFLILDNLRMHHSKPLKAWLVEHTDKIEVFYLPSYSPELNPDERLNADLKFALGSPVQVRTKDRLKAVTENHMAMLAANPQRVKSYFQDPRVKYAA